MVKWTALRKFYLTGLEPQVAQDLSLSRISRSEVIYESPVDGEHGLVLIKGVWYAIVFSDGWKTFCNNDGAIADETKTTLLSTLPPSNLLATTTWPPA